MVNLHRPTEQQIQNRLEQIESDERDRRSVTRRAFALLLIWPLVALACMGWGMHTTDPTLGELSFQVGWLLGNAGIVGTLIWMRQRL